MDTFVNDYVYFIPYENYIQYVIKNQIVTFCVEYYKQISSKKIRLSVMAYIDRKKKNFTRVAVLKDGFYFFKINGLICKTKIDLN